MTKRNCPTLFFFKNHKFIFYHKIFSSLYVCLVVQGETSPHITILQWEAIAKRKATRAAGGFSHLPNSAQNKKEQTWVICRDVDGPRVCHTERSKSDRDERISYTSA